MGEMRVRFAPSPTGPLHIGGARSALFNYLLVRKHQGKFILRIEDTDQERSSRESEIDIMDSLRWLGLDWDEGPDVGGPHGPYRQTERLDIYRKYTEMLMDKKMAYLCYCTEEELEEQRQELKARGQMPRYMGKCYGLSEDERKKLEDEGRKPVIRFRVPENELIKINDLVRGEVNFESSGIGDFVIVKSDGIPTYNFAVVVDDHEMNISHVIRAEEHLSNTPRQVLIFDALGLKKPEFAHISLILGKDRSKMSKRHGATSLNQYKEEGYLPEALVNFLALLGWSPEGEEEVFTLEDLTSLFDLERVAKSPAVFDLEKLRWLNGVYIRKSPIDRIAGLALPYLTQAGYVGEDGANLEYIEKIVDAVRDYLGSVSEIKEHVGIFFDKELTFESEKAVDVLRGEQVPGVLDLLTKKVQNEGELTPDNTKKMIKSICKELDLGGRKVFMPVRVALTGKMHGPEMHDVIPILGGGEILRRINISLEKAGHTLDG
ncbi:MAG: glutamate--tRNA ligase [Clostridia bacterium]|nr:glutamate--tRNA ligase [Clostridia bacterium]